MKTKTKMICIRIDPDTLKEIRQAAKRCGVTMSDFMICSSKRMATKMAMERVSKWAIFDHLRKCARKGGSGSYRKVGEFVGSRFDEDEYCRAISHIPKRKWKTFQNGVKKTAEHRATLIERLTKQRANTDRAKPDTAPQDHT